MAGKGWHHSDDGKKRIINSLKGRSLTAETRKKISLANKGKTISEDERVKRPHETTVIGYRIIEILRNNRDRI